MRDRGLLCRCSSRKLNHLKCNLISLERNLPSDLCRICYPRLKKNTDEMLDFMKAIISQVEVTKYEFVVIYLRCKASAYG